MRSCDDADDDDDDDDDDYDGDGIVKWWFFCLGAGLAIDLLYEDCRCCDFLQ